MFDSNDVRTLLDAHLQTVSGLPDLVTENKRYTPQNVVWCRSTLLPARSTTPVLGQRVQLQGIYQVDVIVPAGSDTTTSAPLCKSIASAFFPGTTVTDGTYVVTLNNITQLPGMVDEQMNYSVPLQVEWFVLTGL
jgi:hypothetical protein